MKPHRYYILFAALLLVHILFFLSSVLIPAGNLPDSEDYQNASRNIYSRGIFYCGDLSESIREEQYTRRPPLYPLLVGIEQLAGSKIPIYLLQIGFSLISIILVSRIFLPGKTGKAINSGNTLPLLLGLVFLMATPAQFIYASRIMTEIPFQLILVLSAWTIFKYSKTRESRYIWLFNLLITLGMATKPVLFPFAILISFLSLIIFLRTRKRAFLLAICLPVAWILFYSAWNYNRTGSTQYSSIQTANLVNYNLRYFLMSEESKEAASSEVDRIYSICGPGLTYAEKNKCLEKQVREIIFDHPLRYGAFHLKGSLRYFLDPGRFDIVRFFNLEESGSTGLLNEINQDGITGAMRYLKSQGWGLILILAIIALFKLIKTAGFVLYIYQKGKDPWLKIYLVILVGYLALVTGPLGASRFLLPVELLIIGASVHGWTTLLSGLKKPAGSRAFTL